MKVVKQFIIKYFNKLKTLIIDNKQIIFMALPFFAMDISTRILGYSIKFYKVYRIVPNLFTLIWVFLFIGIVISIKKSIGKWLYLLINILLLILYMVNNVYYSMTSNFFSFSLLEVAGEGSEYFIDAITNCNIFVYIFFIIIIGLIVLGFKSIPENKIINKKKLGEVLIIFAVIHSLIPCLLGKANSELVWSTWKNSRNIYNLYNDNNKSMRVSGFIEYNFRNFYITYFKPEETKKEELSFLEEIYSKEDSKNKNSYTGKFKEKNLIFLQLEGIDNWLITKKDTPNLYAMMNNSINFTNHYSFYTGGGSTFNSEFAVNTGFIGPLSYNQNVYSFNKNSFPYSMPNIFKNEGYVVNVFHMNSGEYYSRSINYKNWGFDNYYGLIDMYKYKNEEYKLDRELILNTEYSDLMFPTDTNFVNYIITYSNHLPFANTKGVCKQLYDLDNKDNKDFVFKEMTEEECVRRQTKETDDMVGLLLDKLREKDLLNDTVIVAFTDHYLYTLEDQTILKKYKETNNNLINKTPFFIWNNGKTKATIKKVTSQLNVLPTILNLYGIDYNSNYYIQSDALSNSYSGIVFFSDYSWYDGNVYVDGGDVINNKKISQTVLDEKNILINRMAKKNDLTLKYNYFKTITKK